MTNKALTIISIILLTAFNLSAQSANQKPLRLEFSQNQNVRSYDTVTPDFEVEKNYWLAAAEVVGLNIGVWAYTRYISGGSWSYISWESVKNNLKYGFTWDHDGFPINQFFHPYHGANYFNAARSNGLEFWESAPYAFFGSLTWEYFMENEPPSYNDLVNTPITGIILGEVSFRVSNLIIDESTTGLERVVRELSSTLINPMQGLNRMIRGEMWRKGVLKQRTSFSLSVSTGAHHLFLSNKMNVSRTYGLLGIDMNYGDQFAVSRHKNPFDYFTLHTEVNMTSSDNIVGLFASGVL
jgi:hypothetical protein